MAIQKLVAAVQRYTTILKAYIDARAAEGPLVSETATISAGGTKQYALADLADLSGRDTLATRISIKVLDTDTVSETYQQYINSEAAITVGITPEGNVTLVNYSTQSVQCHVRIDLPMFSAA